MLQCKMLLYLKFLGNKIFHLLKKNSNNNCAMVLHHHDQNRINKSKTLAEVCLCQQMM